jgi:hypothetical protein
MTDTTDTDDLTPDGEGTPLGEAERSRERKDERIRELGGIPAHEIEDLPRDMMLASTWVREESVHDAIQAMAETLRDEIEAAD